jgi:hypothetical protein
MSETTSSTGEVSVAGTSVGASEDELDRLVERGSVPNLASLFKKGKDAGLIKPGKEYGGTNPA